MPDCRFHSLSGPALLPEVVDGKATHRPQMKDVRWRQTVLAEAIRSRAMPPSDFVTSPSVVRVP